jgi:hypothetical protein
MVALVASSTKGATKTAARAPEDGVRRCRRSPSAWLGPRVDHHGQARWRRPPPSRARGTRTTGWGAWAGSGRRARKATTHAAKRGQREQGGAADRAQALRPGTSRRPRSGWACIEVAYIHHEAGGEQCGRSEEDPQPRAAQNLDRPMTRTCLLGHRETAGTQRSRRFELGGHGSQGSGAANPADCGREGRTRDPPASPGSAAPPLQSPRAPVAQGTEQRPSNPTVGGSNPPGERPPLQASPDSAWGALAGTRRARV